VTVEKHGNKEKKKLETEPKEAEIVRLIFQLYLFGDGKTGRSASRTSPPI